MKNKPNQLESDLLIAIKQLTKQTGLAPTLSELGDHLGVPKGSVQSALNRLQARGLVTWHPKSPRTLQLIKAAKPAVSKTVLDRLVDRVEVLELKVESLMES